MESLTCKRVGVHILGSSSIRYTINCFFNITEKIASRHQRKSLFCPPDGLSPYRWHVKFMNTPTHKQDPYRWFSFWCGRTWLFSFLFICYFVFIGRRLNMNSLTNSELVLSLSEYCTYCKCINVN